MDTSSQRRSTPGLMAGLYILMLLVIILITTFLLISPVSADVLAQGEQPTAEPAVDSAAPVDEQAVRPPQSSDEEEIARLVFAKIGANREMSLAFLVYETVIDNIAFSEDRAQAAVWLAFRDPETGEIVATEPALAIANRRETGWQVTTMVEDTWFSDLAGLSNSLLSEEMRADFSAPPQQSVSAAAAISGYKLPWAGGTYNGITGSIGHVYTYKSCPTTCLYAFDFANGTMWPIVAARAGKVKYAKWDVPNGSTNATNYIVLEDSSTSPTTYQVYYHLAQDSIPEALRTIGKVVNQGQFIGTADDTGYSTGHHLHFHVHTTPNAVWGTSVDITFSDVLMNGGRPRTCAEARDYPEHGSQCVNGNMLLSGNQSGPKPAAPTVLGPSGLQPSNLPTFTWNTVSGALQYYLAVTNTATNKLVLYPTLNASTCTNGVCSYTPPSAIADGNYRFVVRAGAATGWSAESAAMTFKISLAPPPPELVYPTGTIRELGPFYTWKRVEGATYYYLMVYSNKTSEYIIYRTLYPDEIYRDVKLCEGDTCRYKSTIDVEDGTYVFSVQSGNSLALSDKNTMPFEVSQRPIQPTLGAPDPSELVITALPTYNWLPTETATSYMLQIFSNAQNTIIATHTLNASGVCGETACAVKPTNIKLSGGLYKWRLKGANSYGWGKYTNWQEFTVQLLPSMPAGVTAPTTLALVTTPLPEYSWQTVPNSTKYTIQVFSYTSNATIATYTANASTACIDTACLYKPTKNIAAGKYKWRLRAGNSYGYGKYTAWQDFTVRLVPLEPVLLGPQGTTDTLQPAYTWKPSSGATKYGLTLYSISEAKTIGTVSVNASDVCNETTCSYVLPTTLKNGKQYKFRMRAYNSFGWCKYNTAWMTFTVQLP